MENETQQDKDGVEQAVDILRELKIEREKMEQAAARMEAIEARNLIGGKSEAGMIKKPVEESPSDYAKRIMAGEI